jgi:pimeloyl-ACP methyl ester carboxylesterase
MSLPLFSSAQWAASLMAVMSCLALAELAQAQNPVNAIVFDSDRSGRSQIYIQNVDANQVTVGSPLQVTTGGAGNQQSQEPRWSINASAGIDALGRIAYQFGTTTVSSDTNSARSIHLIKPDGTGDIRLTPQFDSIIARGPQPTLKYPCIDARDPSWSPDGRYIVYACLMKSGTTSSYSLWIHATKGTPDDVNDDFDYSLLGSSNALQLRPAWSPDGETIAFVTNAPSSSGPGSNSKIAVVQLQFGAFPVAVGGSYRFLTDDTYTSFSPAWSPDGQKIAFSSTRTGHRDIFTVGVDGKTPPVQLPSLALVDVFGWDNRNPAWSPDGTTIAFASNRCGDYAIVLVPSDTNYANFVSCSQIGAANDDDPGWMPSKVALFDPWGPFINRYDCCVGQPVSGVAADGVSRVIIRMPASVANEEFSLTVYSGLPGSRSTNAEEDGGLLPMTALDSTSPPQSSLTVQATGSGSLNPTLFAVYVAPIDFSRPSSNHADDSKATRSIAIQIQSITGGGATVWVPVKVARPPVVLVHGNWSGPGSWDPFAQWIPAQFGTLYRLDYSTTMGLGVSGGANIGRCGVGPEVSGSSSDSPYGYQNSHSTLCELNQFIQDFAGHQNVVAVQADVVAYSLGGLMARSWPLQPEFAASLNYQQGPVHKLITIDTPHLGSAQALRLEDSSQGACRLFLETVGLVKKNIVIEQNIIDLMPGSPLLQRLNSETAKVHLQAHVIVTNANAAQTFASETAMTWTPTVIVNPLDAVTTVEHAFAVFCPTFLPDKLGRRWLNIFGEASDLVVGITSQSAQGLGVPFDPPSTSIHGLIHSVAPLGLYPVGPDVLNTDLLVSLVQVGHQPPVSTVSTVIALLNTWVKTGFAAILP